MHDNKNHLHPGWPSLWVPKQTERAGRLGKRRQRQRIMGTQGPGASSHLSISVSPKPFQFAPLLSQPKAAEDEASLATHRWHMLVRLPAPNSEWHTVANRQAPARDNPRPPGPSRAAGLLLLLHPEPLLLQAPALLRLPPEPLFLFSPPGLLLLLQPLSLLLLPPPALLRLLPAQRRRQSVSPAQSPFQASSGFVCP